MTLSKFSLSAAAVLSFTTSAFARPLLLRQTDQGYFAIPGNIEIICKVFKDKVVISQGQKGSDNVEVREKPFNESGIEALIAEAQKAEIKAFPAYTDGPTRIYVAFNNSTLVDLGSYTGDALLTKNESAAALELRAILDKNCPPISASNPRPIDQDPLTGNTISPPSQN